MFVTLEEFPRWEISQTGHIRHRKTKKAKSVEIHDGAYLRVQMHIAGKRVNKKVHRLVAETFIPNPDNKKTINHINGIKLDNHVDNLEWATNQENIDHAWATGLCVPPNIKAHSATQLQGKNGFGLVCFGHLEFPHPLRSCEVSNCINRPHKNLSARGWKISRIELPKPIRW
jgi:hypothetical protein